ncbi:hypothetical protein TcasGA2_TC005962 [Tribolium castaneum]|uniref:Uncharacterized protein n=1 Tax=Tribolium castaneum TaxID=7070 RepID=D6WV39_TRICA|nr:hypothetical protein TcasGA2_TC005962 [Tribolium castaneum]
MTVTAHESQRDYRSCKSRDTFPASVAACLSLALCLQITLRGAKRMCRIKPGNYEHYATSFAQLRPKYSKALTVPFLASVPISPIRLYGQNS